MEDLIKIKIYQITENYKIKTEDAVVLFYSYILKKYFSEILGKESEIKIARIINKQIHLDLFRYPSLDNEDIILEIEKIIEKNKIDLITLMYDKVIDKKLRKIFGKYYTPEVIVDHIIDSIGIEIGNDKKVIDLSCGSGIFLIRILRKMIEKIKKDEIKENKEYILQELISCIYGIDIDEAACSLTKLNLLFTTFDIWKEIFMKKEEVNINFNIFTFNSLNIFRVDSPISGIKFDYVVGNPPYVEAKKLPKEEKAICRTNFPNVSKGAFDLYVCFVYIGLLILKKGGYLGLVLPNKFLVANYNKYLREFILKNCKIIEICDISNLKYFSDTDVYPILLIINNECGLSKIKTISNIKNKIDFENKNYSIIEFNQEWYSVLDGSYPFFLFDSELDKNILFKIISNSNQVLGNYIRIKTSVSFHFKGLREEYISKNISKNKYKYLGGESYTRKNEIDSFKVDWKGYYIDYDINKLKELNNPMPPISNFLRPKIIFCQHAKRMLAYADIKGEWVTKDVYPIAFIESKDKIDIIKKTYYYTGLLNSNIFSYLYSLIWKGIQISEGYFHFLPSFLSIIPVPEENLKEILNISKKVKILQSQENNSNSELIKDINKIFYKLYNLSSAEIDRVEQYNNMYLKK